MEDAANMYLFFRSGCGMSLIVAGIGFFIDCGRGKLRVPLGALFTGVGGLFCFSALSDLLKLPLEADGLIVVLLVFVTSQAFYELILYTMGGSRAAALVRGTYTAGGLWSAALVLLPLLDYVFKLEPAITSIEDGIVRPPLHAVAVVFVYLWPLAATTAAFFHSRWHLSDIPLGAKAFRQVKIFAAAAIPILTLIAAALAMSEQGLYRIGNVLLGFYMVLMYLFLIRYPESPRLLRKAVGEEHRRKLSIEESEALEISRRLDNLVKNEKVHLTQGLSIDALAKRLKIPAYRLSRYFSQYEGLRFPVWLNTLRIEHVCGQMRAHPKRTILDIAFEAGYVSKTAFNKQFLALKGVSPSEYRNGVKSG